jgi:hypothetical protein
MAKVINCLVDGEPCDLNPHAKRCRLIQNWMGKCNNRVEGEEKKKAPVWTPPKAKVAAEVVEPVDMFDPAQADSMAAEEVEELARIEADRDAEATFMASQGPEVVE